VQPGMDARRISSCCHGQVGQHCLARCSRHCASPTAGCQSCSAAPAGASSHTFLPADTNSSVVSLLPVLLSSTSRCFLTHLLACRHQFISSQPGVLLLLQPAIMLPLTTRWERCTSTHACSHWQVVPPEGPGQEVSQPGCCTPVCNPW